MGRLKGERLTGASVLTGFVGSTTGSQSSAARWRGGRGGRVTSVRPPRSSHPPRTRLPGARAPASCPARQARCRPALVGRQQRGGHRVSLANSEKINISNAKHRELDTTRNSPVRILGDVMMSSSYSCSVIPGVTRRIARSQTQSAQQLATCCGHMTHGDKAAVT